MASYNNANPSRLQQKARAILDSGDILYVTEFSYPDLKSSKGNPLRFDIAVFESIQDMEAENPKFLLQLNGQQHYERCFQTAVQFAEQQSNDKKKRNYCRVKGIPLVEIPYTNYNTMTLDSILEAGHFFD